MTSGGGIVTPGGCKTVITAGPLVGRGAQSSADDDQTGGEAARTRRAPDAGTNAADPGGAQTGGHAPAPPSGPQDGNGGTATAAGGDAAPACGAPTRGHAISTESPPKDGGQAGNGAPRPAGDGKAASPSAGRSGAAGDTQGSRCGAPRKDGPKLGGVNTESTGGAPNGGAHSPAEDGHTDGIPAGGSDATTMGGDQAAPDGRAPDEGTAAAATGDAQAGGGSRVATNPSFSQLRECGVCQEQPRAARQAAPHQSRALEIRTSSCKVTRLLALEANNLLLLPTVLLWALTAPVSFFTTDRARTLWFGRDPLIMKAVHFLFQN